MKIQMFRLSMTVSQIGLMESCMCHHCHGGPSPTRLTPPKLSMTKWAALCCHGGPPWLAGWPPTGLIPPGWLSPTKLSVMKWAALWSHVCVVVEDHPRLADPPCLAWECDGWLGCSAFTLTKLTCYKIFVVFLSHQMLSKILSLAR